MRLVLALLLLASGAACSDGGGQTSPDEITDAVVPGADVEAGAAPCGVADHCLVIDDEGAIGVPDLVIEAGESVAFSFANRWQSVIDIERHDPGACDDGQLERRYSPGEGVTGPMPHLAGGVTVRGPPDGQFRFPAEVWQSDAISGVLLVVPWRDLEGAQGEYDFTVFTDALREAVKYGKLVSIGVQMGAKCPSWIYDLPPDDRVPGNALVTKANAGDRCFDQVHPSFWHPNYRRLLTALQTALSEAVRARAGAYRHVDKIKISGVNLLTSETRMPVNRDEFCGFRDAACSNGNRAPDRCIGGACPDPACGCEVDPADGQEKCGRSTGDLPQAWADAGYRPSKLSAYFSALFDEQHALFPGKDINLMEIARAFPDVNEQGEVRGFANPNDVRALIAQSQQALPDHFVVLNAALNGRSAPQDICLESFDAGVKQIGFQMIAGLNTWAAVEPALVNARDVETPAGARAVSFVEIYLETFGSIERSGDAAGLRAFDEVFRDRSNLPSDHGESHRIENLPPGTYHYKVAGTHMRSGRCHMGTITVQ
jgi:hypothetical protein